MLKNAKKVEKSIERKKKKTNHKDKNGLEKKHLLSSSPHLLPSYFTTSQLNVISYTLILENNRNSIEIGKFRHYPKPIPATALFKTTSLRFITHYTFKILNIVK